MTKPASNLTIFSDASYCPETGAAGWGMWAKGDGREAFTYGGAIKPACLNSSEAELFAIANALSAVKGAGWIAVRTVIFIQSDSERALQVILQGVSAAIERRYAKDGRRGHAVSRGGEIPRLTFSPAEKSALDHIRKLVVETGCRLIVRHVNGHVRGRGRNWVNSECDRIAREEMEKMRGAIRGKRRHA